MDADTMPHKTLRGYEEIRTRQHRLSLLARRILIMADGRRSLAALADELDRDPAGTEFRAAVEALFGGEFVSCSDLAPERGTGGKGVAGPAGTPLPGPR